MVLTGPQPEHRSGGWGEGRSPSRKSPLPAKAEAKPVTPVARPARVTPTGPCKPIRLRQIDSTHAVFALRCGPWEYPGWMAVWGPAGLSVSAPRGVPAAVLATIPALLVPVFVAWLVAAGVGKWPK